MLVILKMTILVILKMTILVILKMTMLVTLSDPLPVIPECFYRGSQHR